MARICLSTFDNQTKWPGLLLLLCYDLYRCQSLPSFKEPVNLSSLCEYHWSGPTALKFTSVSCKLTFLRDAWTRLYNLCRLWFLWSVVDTATEVNANRWLVVMLCMWTLDIWGPFRAARISLINSHHQTEMQLRIGFTRHSRVLAYSSAMVPSYYMPCECRQDLW